VAKKYTRGGSNRPAERRAAQARRGESEKPDNYVKVSGCKMKASYTSFKTREVVDSPCVTGWKKEPTGEFFTFIAVLNKDSATKSDTWEKMVVKFKRKGPYLPQLTTGFWDGKRVHMPDLQMIANPSAPDGGYWGQNHE
jgi:hypothetical protein